MPVRIEPAADVPWSDVEHALTGGGDGASCSCQWFLLTRKDFDANSSDEKRSLLRRELRGASPSPALVAYVDDSPAAWVRISPRPAQPALARSRVVKGSDQPLEDGDVWAITCFVVRREHRGKGLAKKLVTAAVDHARANGARVVEAYPIDTERHEATSNELFRGSARLFKSMHFELVSRPTDSRVVMARVVRRRT